MPSPSPSAERRRRHREHGEQRPHRRVRARAVVPGTRYKITRRCLERRLFLTPDSPEIREIIGYILGLCLEDYGLQLHAACFMGNHYHLDVTDTRGEFPAFKCKFNSLVAKALNAHRGRFDRFWSGDTPCDVELVDDDDVVDRMVYTLVNPVAAGLVPRARRWTGLSTAGVEFGTQMVFRRPAGYFDSENPNVPAASRVTVVRPQVMEDLSDSEFQRLLEDKVRRREAEEKARMRAENRRFACESRVARQNWRSQPKRREDRFTTTPRIAAGSMWSRFAAQQRDRSWQADYAEAYAARLRGESFVFPYGTYAERRFRNVSVADPPG